MGKRYLFAAILLGLVLVAALTGCANQPEPTTTGDKSTSAPGVPELRLTQTSPAGLEQVQPTESNSLGGEVPAIILDEIIADLIQRTGFERQDIEVVNAETVVWDDGSLGCPKPGEVYLQILVNGYWVVLEVEGIEYDYRTSGTGHFALCEGRGPLPISPLGDPGGDVENSLVIQAKGDLAEHLNIPVKEIDLFSFEEVVWPDASLGCPQPGMFFAQVVTPGYRILLDANGERYMYHTDNRQRVVYCGPEGAGRLLGGESTEAVNLAKDDLARRLGISADSIDIVAVIRQEFPADAFYCRTTKERVARDESPSVILGENILLSAAGRKYEYHASDQTMIYCRQLRQ